MDKNRYGIDCIDIFVPPLFVQIKDLAQARNIEQNKLEKGLGLNKMSVLDIDEDTATIAAESALKLIRKNNIDPRNISRIYLGTESSLDAAKPTSSYVAEILQAALEEDYGENIFKNCDVLDMTFACIGAVDALENALDFVKSKNDKMALVIAADYAKYELSSAGEYTQGAGSVSMLIKKNPRLAVVDDNFGVSFKSVGDFFKPRRAVKASMELKSILREQELDFDDAFMHIHSDHPVFDGQFSNDCYKERITEALYDFSPKENINIDSYRGIIFHLPYAFQGRRMFVSNYMSITKKGDFEDEKTFSKSQEYINFVLDKISDGEKISSEVGNMYTGSIFASFISFLEHNLNKDLNATKFLFLSYGSGSKSKVFQMRISSQWKEQVEKIQALEMLKNRHKIDFEIYEKLHKGNLEKPFISKKIKLKSIDKSGYRNYSVCI